MSQEKKSGLGGAIGALAMLMIMPSITNMFGNKNGATKTPTEDIQWQNPIYVAPGQTITYDTTPGQHKVEVAANDPRANTSGVDGKTYYVYYTPSASEQLSQNASGKTWNPFTQSWISTNSTSSSLTAPQSSGAAQNTLEPPNCVSGERDLVDYYFKPLFSESKCMYFQFRGTYTASPYLVTITSYANADEAVGRTARIPTTNWQQQNPNEWLPARVVS